ILPGLDRTPRSEDKPLFCWKETPRFLVAPINATGDDKDPLYEYIRGLNREAEDIEAGRLFYVAATRARHRLHLLGVAKVDDHGDLREPAKRSLLARIWWQAETHFVP